jgi:hypothetical protein
MSVKRGGSGKKSDVDSLRAGTPASDPEEHVTAGQGKGDREALEEEIACYRANLTAWCGHQGEHVLIRGGTVYGFFGTRNEALREGLRRFGRVAFLVKQVDVDEKPRPLVQVLL